MPDDKQHIFQAKHNIDFLKTFYSMHEYNDWSITVSFYASLHIIENAIFKRRNLVYNKNQVVILGTEDLHNQIKMNRKLGPINFSGLSLHALRIALVNENFNEIFSWFHILYDNSYTARYHRYTWSKPEVEFIVKPALKEIVNWSNGKFGTDFEFLK